MSDFKTRLVEEKEQLDEKIAKLHFFVTGENFANVTPIQQSLLSIQLDAMRTYARILSERINNLD